MNLDDKTFLQSLGDRLRDLRTARGLTQADLGEKCELHRTFIGSVERGERNVSILNLRLFPRVLRIAMSELVKDLSWEFQLTSESSTGVCSITCGLSKTNFRPLLEIPIGGKMTGISRTLIRLFSHTSPRVRPERFRVHE